MLDQSQSPHTVAAIQFAQAEKVAAKNKSTPVSFIGGYQIIWPLASGSTGFVSVLRYAGVALLLVLYWIAVTTTFYAVMLSTLLGMVLWLVYTTHRRRTIENARLTVASKADLGS
jgi:hypothetical protein